MTLEEWSAIDYLVARRRPILDRLEFAMAPARFKDAFKITPFERGFSVHLYYPPSMGARFETLEAAEKYRAGIVYYPDRCLNVQWC